ncbi:MAG: hypothetical protein R2711_09085 [Acidimicrobiales bacterium]
MLLAAVSASSPCSWPACCPQAEVLKRLHDLGAGVEVRPQRPEVSPAAHPGGQPPEDFR